MQLPSRFRSVLVRIASLPIPRPTRLRIDGSVGLVLLALLALLCAWTHPALPEEAPGEAPRGTISGRVFDEASGAPIQGVTVILQFPDPGDGSDPRQELATSGPAGDYEFGAVPAGSYTLSFIKSGYRASTVKDFPVEAGQDNVQNFPMPVAASAPTAGGDVIELDDYVVEAAVVDDLMEGLELRMDSDMQVNLLSAEDLSKYAASDVADALKRVAGVNIVEGQFAIIRGLEDRYSSTMFNGAPVPSPDPDRQSVQLDLFPSEVVSNLVVAKTFEPASPSNSSGGSIDIVTLDYPEALTVKLAVGSGFEEGAKKRFLKLKPGSTVGKETDPTDIIESDVSGLVGGQTTLLRRVLRFKGAVNHEIDYRTEQGFQEGRQPRAPVEQRRGTAPPLTLRSGDLAHGVLSLSDGHFDQTQSTRTEQLAGFAALGVDLDEQGDHRVDATYFHINVKQETVELRENGYFPDLDYTPLVEATSNGDLTQTVLNDTYEPVATLQTKIGRFGPLREELTDTPARGALWFANFGRSNSFERDRDLDVYQLNGDHDFDLLDGLEVTWATNYATSTQDESSRGMRFFYEPCGFAGGYGCPADVSRIAIPTSFPSRVSSLGPGRYFASGASGGIVNTEVNIEEAQYFARFDADQTVEVLDFLSLNAKLGVWYEHSKRDVDAYFVENVTVGGTGQWLLDAPTLGGLGGTLFDRFDTAAAERNSQTKASREIAAGHAQIKLTFWEDLDLLGGLRYEDIFIDSKNSPFTGEMPFNRPATFPPAYLFFDRLDNPDFGEVTATTNTADVVFNDQILGINTPINPDTGYVDLLTKQQILALANGEIDERKLLPSAGITYRPYEGLTLRAAYSETVARPSYREMGYYVTVQPGTDERTVGNPQLELSDVQSYDARAEYVYGDLGDLFAFSVFYKVIDKPIESIIVRNPLDADSGAAALYRTFFNNPNTARLWGIELEARKSFDFVRKLGADFPGVDALDYLSVGGNFSWIQASVRRTPAELSRAQRFFNLSAGDTPEFNALKDKRRLFGQPEWLANADISFNHPDWGTTLTLAVFAVSDVLDAAGTASIGRDRVTATALTLDRYLDDFYQLDLVASQEIWRGLRLKLSVKNLTDSPRRRVYDRQQTVQTYVERSRRFGRDWSISLGYTIDF